MSDTPKPLLQVNKLVCGYYKKEIVHGVSFNMDRGQFTCIIGANGCGKTTLLKTILGLLPEFSGTVSIDGQSLSTLSDLERARLVAYIPQAHASTFPFLVSDVVLMGRTPHVGRFSKISHEDKRAAWDALCAMGIEHLADRTYTRLSGGQQQLVLIARALAQKPKLIVMDEPTASLDFGNQQIVLSRMRELSKQGASVLMVTHDPHHALYCANTVIVMGQGNILKVGTPQETITTETLQTIYGTQVDVLDVTLTNGEPSRVCVPL